MASLSAIILAAGKGTRMKAALPKVLHPVAGLPMISYPLRICDRLGIKNKIVVASKDYKPLQEGLEQAGEKSLTWAVQDPPLGTGHAVMAGMKKFKETSGNVIILYGDMPLVRQETIEKLLKEHRSKKAALSFVTALMDQNTAYGRVVRDKAGLPSSIVEYKDATPEQRALREVNLGIYVADVKFLKSSLKKIKAHNAQKEYYLTDLIQLAYYHQEVMTCLITDDADEGLGVNTQEQLADVQSLVFCRIRKNFLDEGVRMTLPETIVIEKSVSIGNGTLITGPAYFMGKTKIGKNCIIEPGTYLKDTIVGDGTHLKAYTYANEAIIGENGDIGPFAHLRPHTELGAKVKVGNFVEIKKSKIKEGSKVNHLTYIGDAEIGKGVNVGAGTITCNYDGVNKFKTVLEDGVFVGSDTQFVAPVRIGKGAFIGAGSTITKDVKAGSLALTRAQQTEIKDWTKRKSKLKKASKKKS